MQNSGYVSTYCRSAMAVVLGAMVLSTTATANIDPFAGKFFRGAEVDRGSALYLISQNGLVTASSGSALDIVDDSADTLFSGNEKTVAVEQSAISVN